MSNFEPITEKELRKLQKASQPDDSVSVPQYEAITPQEAAKVEEVLDRKIVKGEKLDKQEQLEYETMQQIADRGGVLPSDLKPGDGPFKNDQDMLKKEGEQ